MLKGEKLNKDDIKEKTKKMWKSKVPKPKGQWLNLINSRIETKKKKKEKKSLWYCFTLESFFGLSVVSIVAPIIC